MDRGLNSIVGHILTNIYRKIETGFYFDFRSLTLQTFAILYFSYLHFEQVIVSRNYFS